MVFFFHLLRPATFQYSRLFLIAAVLGMCQSAWMAIATTQWNNVTMLLREDLRTHTGAIPYENSTLAKWQVDGQPSGRSTSDWAIAFLSIFYSDHLLVKSMIVPAPGTGKVDPYSPSTLPNLQRFGITYGPYAATLHSDRPYKIGEWASFTERGDGSMQKGKDGGLPSPGAHGAPTRPQLLLTLPGPSIPTCSSKPR